MSERSACCLIYSKRIMRRNTKNQDHDIMDYIQEIKEGSVARLQTRPTLN